MNHPVSLLAAPTALALALMLGACSGASAPMSAPMSANESDDSLAAAGNLVAGPRTVDLPGGEMAPTDNGAAIADTRVTDGWVGHWVGVEGLVLDIAADADQGPGHYWLTMRYGLDDSDQGRFAGVAQGDTIRFTRPDGEQTLKAGDGAATGLKWLDGKKDCLVVKAGEGYCRD